MITDGAKGRLNDPRQLTSAVEREKKKRKWRDETEGFAGQILQRIAQTRRQIMKGYGEGQRKADNDDEEENIINLLASKNKSNL